MMKKKGLRRAVGIRAPKPKFIIITEGEKTEPAYFESLRRVCDHIIIEIIAAAGTPDQIKKIALKKRKSFRKNFFEKNDQIWTVFDRDSHDFFLQTIDTLEKNHVGVAYSNPCFELWLMLHYKEYDRACNRWELQKEFSTVCSAYDKDGAKVAKIDDLFTRLELAESRAEIMYKRRIEDGGQFSSTCTTVFKLTLAMRRR